MTQAGGHYHLFGARPWQFRESSLVALGLLLGGLALQYALPIDFSPYLSMPYNLYAAFFFFNLLIISYFLFKKSRMINFLAGIPAAGSAIVLFTVLTLIMGFVPQEPQRHDWLNVWGLRQITNTWYFVLAQLWFFITLGMVILKRAIPFKVKHIGFLLNHLGLFVVVFTASLGSGDVLRLKMLTQEGQSSNIAVDQDQQAYNLPFTVYLEDFELLNYPPKLLLADQDQSLQMPQKANSIEEGKSIDFQNYKVKVLRYLPLAWQQADSFVCSDKVGASPAAFLQITDNKGESLRGWVSAGTFRQQATFLQTDKQHSLIMAQPQARSYRSHIRLKNSDNQEYKAIIEVNKPYQTGGFRLYQYSYDERMGQFSRTSILEVVRDPWLPVVYIGIFMLIAGALYMFWTGRRRKIQTR